MKKLQQPSSDKKQTTDSNQLFFREVDIEYLIHELKDPISIIESNMKVLLNKKDHYGPLSDIQERLVRRTLRSSQKTREMLNGLLEIGRSQTGHLNACQFHPIHSIYSQLIDSLEIMTGTIIDEPIENGDRKKIDRLLVEQGINFDISEEVLDIQINQDETKFRQIIGNLIKNALHHRKKQINIKITEDNNMFLVLVTDDGPGIDSKYHEMIFQRYFQVKGNSTATRNGHGLGLAGSRILARRLGGEVDLISNKGQGTTFRLTLPMGLNI